MFDRKTELSIVNHEGVVTVPLNMVKVGTWFTHLTPGGGSVVAIKGDDTVYDGRKTLCMCVHPSSGIIARYDSNSPVKPIERAEITLT